MTTERTVEDTRHAGMERAVFAEWTKLVSVRSTWWVLGAAAVVVPGIAALSAAGLNQPAADAALDGSGMGQLLVAVLAALFITSEHATGSITSSLLWNPVRLRFVAAKAVVVAGLGVVAGTTYYLVAVAAAAAVLGDASVDLGQVARNAAMAGGLAAAECLITLGLGTLLRSTAATLVAYLVLGVVLPGVLLGVPNDLVSSLADYLPLMANGVVTGESDGPYPVVAAWLVLAAWGLGLLGLGVATMRRRDV